MNKFIRRIYYLLATGEIIYGYSMENEHYMPSIEADYEVYAQLKPYADRRDEIGLMEWIEPDPEIEDQFARAYGYSVDVSQDPPALVFDFTPPPEPEPEIDERDEALRLLGIDTSGNILEQAMEIREATEFGRSISIDKPIISKTI